MPLRPARRQRPTFHDVYAAVTGCELISVFGLSIFRGIWIRRDDAVVLRIDSALQVFVHSLSAHIIRIRSENDALVVVVTVRSDVLSSGRLCIVDGFDSYLEEPLSLSSGMQRGTTDTLINDSQNASSDSCLACDCNVREQRKAQDESGGKTKHCRYWCWDDCNERVTLPARYHVNCAKALGNLQDWRPCTQSSLWS